MTRYKTLIIVGVCAGFLLASSAAAPAVNELDLVTHYEFVPVPVGTEKISELDPGHVNPHRQRWVLSRNIELKGLEAVELKDKRFGIRARSVESLSKGYIRGPGPWYRPMSEFPCVSDRAPNADWFATEEGVRKAVVAAAVEWNSILRSERLRLSHLLALVSEKSRHEAVRKALAVYDSWLHRAEAEWRERAARAATRAEWREYVATGLKVGQCRMEKGKLAGARPESPEEPAWSKMMEPPGQVAPAKPLVRIPARRWNGFYSVRLTVEIAARSLTGQFLVDAGASKSILSPAWLDSQGMPLSYVELKHSAPQRATFPGGSALANRGMVDRATLSGYEIGIEDFLITTVDLFGPPRNLAGCCDGVLGTDFLRKHVVEFRPGPPAELLIWPAPGFRPPLETGAPAVPPWAELHLEPTGELVSDCVARSEKDPFGSKGARPITGVRWDTASERAMDIHAPYSGADARKGGGRLWSLDCEDQVIARQIPATFHPDAGPRSAYSRSYPSANIGMPVLGRGAFTFDLPHGRIWFDRLGLLKPVPENRTGLSLKYILSEGERVLRVSKIEPGSPAAKLAKSGLNEGTAIQDIDGKPAEDLDSWEVEQRLSGVYGDKVTLSWERKKGELVVAPLTVTPSVVPGH